MILANLLADLEQKGIRLSADGGQLNIRAPKGALTPDLRDQLAEHKGEILNLLNRVEQADESAPMLEAVPDPSQRYLPFPLTDIQQAYWVGRTSAFDLGNVSIHMYWELERSGLDMDRLEEAWNRCVDRHDMLRAVVLPDGQMQILERVPRYRIPAVDLRGKEASEIASELEAIRSRLSHQVLAVDRWPAFEMQASRLDGDRIRMHVSIDLVHIDASSLIVLFRDWERLYREPEVQLAPLELSFRDYVLAVRKLRESAAYQRSLEYWKQRVASLPPAPELPLTKNPSGLTQPRFARRTARLEAPTWRRLKQQASELGLTPSAVLLAAYAEVLRAWAGVPEFSVNVTLFNRLPVHPQVNDILGDFTSMILLEVPNCPEETFAGRARRLQERLWSDLEYNQSSGVESLRELARVQQRGTGAVMPIVFTSLLSLGPRGFQPVLTKLGELGEVVFEITQTPQVWLDHQVFEESDALVFNWDGVEALFPAGMLDSMFGAYCGLVHKLADGEGWQEIGLPLVPTEQIEQRAIINATEAPIPTGLLQTLFEENARRRPESPAVMASTRTLTYAQLDKQSNRAGHRLRELGVKPNTLVAVVMEKGWEQIVAVFGILKAGGAYLPVDADFPAERIRLLLESGEVEIALLQSRNRQRLALPEHIRAIAVDEDELEGADDGPVTPVQRPDDLAYVLYTSGSTGKPKGVMIEHRSVINRMADVAQRFGLRPEDRAIAITALHHDLSVFDIFGMLAIVGGSIAIPDATRDPGHWAEVIGREKITVWNSVPTFMQMLVEHLEDRSDRAALSGSLRWVILSGEFIPADLPDRLREIVAGVEVVGAGGPTETCVWDICYPIGEVDPRWTSIPYGRPMRNAQYYVLHQTLEACPTWVPGELYIAGAGLARGYWRDEERTNASFFHHPRTGQRLYRSGDMGRYLADGNIEILGRKDLQVKIRGNRIELGEIETTLSQHPAIKAAVVKVVGAGADNKRLVAYVVPSELPQPDDGGTGGKANEEWLSNFSDQPFEGVIRDPIQRLEFLMKQRNGSGYGAKEVDVRLPRPEWTAGLEKEYLQRRSQRSFLISPVGYQEFGEFLACLREVKLEELLLPKFRYPSAGGLYPVRTYLYVAPDGVEGLAAGTYSYDARTHGLKAISPEARLDRAIHAPPNRAIFDGAAFSLFLVGDMSAIQPMYGDLARDFCVLEAGYMSQLLMTTAPGYRVGLCPIGGVDFASVREAFGLEEKQIYLHCLVGGATDPEQAVVAPTMVHKGSEAAGATSRSGETLIGELRSFLRERLPEFMVPTAFVLLDKIPVTATGKIDRAALPSPDETHRGGTRGEEMPQTEMERVLATVLCELLTVESLGVNDNFFDLGANSMHMVRFSGKLKEVLDREVTVLDMFKYPSVGLLAGYLSEAPAPPSFQQVDRRAEKQIEAARRQRQRREDLRNG